MTRKTKRFANMFKEKPVKMEDVIDFLKSIKEFRDEKGNLPFGTLDYYFIDGSIEFLKQAKSNTLNEVRGKINELDIESIVEESCRKGVSSFDYLKKEILKIIGGGDK